MTIIKFAKLMLGAVLALGATMQVQADDKKN